jgi:two-component system alkaline phosphatase synthesis response regulator PhoP
MEMEQNLRILLVEDEEHLAETISFNLEMEGYDVKAVNNGSQAVRTFKGEKFNLVILDVMLPEMDGFAVCEAIRLHDSHVPVLFLSAKNTSEDKITGLKRGADDYMTKPFNLEEFLLRVSALIKRGLSHKDREKLSDTFRFGNNEIKDKNGKKISLTKREILLLKLLIERRNEVVSRQQILETVWGYEVFPTTRTVDNFILSFRKYFEQDPRNPRYFFSIRGVGYKFLHP